MRWLAAGVAVLAFTAAGCGGSETAGSGAAGIIPAGVSAFVAVDADPSSSQWKSVNELASKFPDKQRAVESIKKDIRDEGFDWDRDIKPALGSDLDAVWLDFVNGGQNVVGLIQPDDEDAFARALTKANAKDPSNKVVYEMFRGWTLISNNQALIDRFESMSDSAAGSLEEDPAFTKAMESTPEDAL
jgi:hypothetical protein